ncbi:MAG: hypothetical protein QW727_00215 [Candidatus Pacearchaeota archaeon]
MSKISNQKKEKISEYILSFLFQSFPKPLFTSYIAKEVARDEEFVKKILLELSSKKLIVPIYKNHKGIHYFRRIRWKLSNQAYKVYTTR